MGILEEINEKLDLILSRLPGGESRFVVTSTGTMDGDGNIIRKRNRYVGEISNSALSGYLNIGYIGNKTFCKVAEEAGIEVTYHGTHPYIKDSCIGLWVKAWRGED